MKIMELLKLTGFIDKAFLYKKFLKMKIKLNKIFSPT